jgi:hypothetical protein
MTNQLRRRVQETLSIAEYPDVRFLLLEPIDVDDPVALVTTGATRDVRDNATRRFRAALIEFGCFARDLAFFDADEVNVETPPC